jgi:hypothetical protein
LANAPDNRLMAVLIQVDSEHQTVSLGAPIALFTARVAGVNGAGSSPFAVSPAGQRFRVNSLSSLEEANPSPITVVQNWIPPHR